MRILLKGVTINNKQFVLFTDDTADGQKYYATLPLEAIAEDGTIKKRFDALSACVSFSSAHEAIYNRMLRETENEYAKDHTERETKIFAFSKWALTNN